MGRPQQIAWFAVRTDAEVVEKRLHAQALVNGQKCERWAEIIEDKAQGFGVPVKDRVKVAMKTDELAKVALYAPVADVSAIR